MDQTPLLPASCLVAPVVWELDTDIAYRTRSTPVSRRASVRSVCCPCPVDLLGPHIILLWSAGDRLDGALSDWEVLVAHLG